MENVPETYGKKFEVNIDNLSLLPLIEGKTVGEQIDKNRLADPEVIGLITKGQDGELVYIPEHWRMHIPNDIEANSNIPKNSTFGVFTIDPNNPKVLNEFRISYDNSGKAMLLDHIGAGEDIKKLKFDPYLQKVKLVLDSDPFEMVVGKDWNINDYILVEK